MIGVLGSIIGGIFTCKTLPIIAAGKLNYDFVAIVCCLIASYIGGTLNFFETAKYLNIEKDDKKILNFMAAADIGVMIVYFSLLNGFKSLASKWKQTSTLKINPIKEAPLKETNPLNVVKRTSTLSILSFLTRSVWLTGSSFLLCFAASWLQDWLGIAGVSCAMVTVFAMRAAKIIASIEKEKREKIVFAAAASGEHVLQLFYATLGMQTNLIDLFRNASQVS